MKFKQIIEQERQCALHLFTFFIFGSLLFVAGGIASDLIGILYGLFFLFSGIGFLLSR